jgi:ferredoxin-NADP reductase
VAGGSGVVPLMAMLRHRTAAGSRAKAVLLYSSRRIDGIIYHAELERLTRQNGGVNVVHTLTRAQPAGWSGLSRRIDRAMLRSVGFPPSARPRIFVCGPTPLVEAAARNLREIGHERGLIKTERFGPTGS